MSIPFCVSMEHPGRETHNTPMSQQDYQGLKFRDSSWMQHQHVGALPRRLPAELQRPLWHRWLHWPTCSVESGKIPQLHEGLAVFCFTACQGPQTALDVSLDGSHQGCLTYILHTALGRLGPSCTYLELLETMASIGLRLRQEVLPYMDQLVQLSYADCALPGECLLFDEASAISAWQKTRRRRGQRHRLRSGR